MASYLEFFSEIFNSPGKNRQALGQSPQDLVLDDTFFGRLGAWGDKTDSNYFTLLYINKKIKRLIQKSLPT